MWLFSVLVLATSAGPPAGSPAANHLARAKVCYDSGDFACASKELVPARAGIANLDKLDSIDVWALSAAAALANDEEGVAEGFIKSLLLLEPYFEPAGWKPAWVTVFERVRSRLPDKSAPLLTVTTPAPGLRAGEPATFVVVTRDTGRVDRVRLGLGKPMTRLLPFSTKDRTTWTLTLPGPEVRAPTLYVWIEAWDAAGNQASWGSQTVPRRLAVTPNWAAKPVPSVAAEPIAEQWWFWTIVGAAIIAGVSVGLVVGLQPEPGKVIVPVVSP